MMLLVLNLALALNGIALKQRFNDCNSIELINEKSQINGDQKSNLLFLQRYNWYWRIWFKLTKNRQKVLQRYWYLLYCVYYN